ncbi:MAG: hypothetical protein Q9217_006426 [Psora testacea]
MRKALPLHLYGRSSNAFTPATYVPYCRFWRSQVRLINPCRHFAEIRPDREVLSEVWFTPSSPCRQLPKNPEPESQTTPPDDRTLKLGKSNVKLIILSERVIKNGPASHISPSATSVNNERLIVRWKTSGKTKGKGMGALYRGIGASERVDKITQWLGGDAKDDEEFCGLFIFEFDEEGRILTHTIEHAEESGHWDRMSRVVSVTDWLLGRMNGKTKEPQLALNYVEQRKRFQHRERDKV